LSTESVGSRRELVANSCTHRRRRRDATRQLSRVGVGVGGVYWLSETPEQRENNGIGAENDTDLRGPRPDRTTRSILELDPLDYNRITSLDALTGAAN